MSDIFAVAKEMVHIAFSDTPEDIDIPDSVGEDEAIHAVQKHYGDAGFECDEPTAREIVTEARADPGD